MNHRLPDLGLRVRVILALLVLVAFGMRIHHLGYESFWIDEADSVRIASAPLAELVARLTEVGQNGPLYHVLLRLWLAATGESEFAVRYLSLVFSVVTVPLFAALGARFGGPTLAVVMALLATTSSYLGFYGQEAKMYSIIIALSALTGILVDQALNSNNRLAWVGFVAAASLALYTHVFGALLIPAAITYALLRWSLFRRAWRSALIAFAGLTLPYLPLGAWHLWALGLPRPPTGSFYGSPGLDEMVRLLLARFGTIQPNLPEWLVWSVFGGLALLGIAAYWRSDEVTRARGSFVIAFFLVPCVLTAIVVLRMPIFLERYLSPVLPALYLALGGGILAFGRLWRPLAIAPIAVLLALNAPPWVDAHIHGTLSKDEWRPAVQYVEGKLEARDIVVFIAGDSHITYDYYARKSYSRGSGSESAGRTPDNLDRAIRNLIRDKERIWLIRNKWAQEDVDAWVGWLVKNATRVDEHNFHDVLISRWLPNPPSPLPTSPSRPVDLDIEDRLSLSGFDVFDDSGVVPVRCTTVPAECAIRLMLHWQAGERLDRDMRVSTKLVDEQGTIWGQFDLAPNAAYPIGSWRPGYHFRDERYLTVVPGMPAARYRLVLSAYDSETGAAFSIAGSDALPTREAVLTTIAVRPPADGWLESAIPASVTGRFVNGVRLVGAEVPTQAGAGQSLATSVYISRPDSNAHLSLHFSLSRGGQPGLNWTSDLAEVSGLQAVKVNRPLPGNLPGGIYQLRASLHQDNTIIRPNGPPLFGLVAFDLGTVEIRGRTIRTNLPEVRQQLNVRFGPVISLLGLNLRQREPAGDLAFAGPVVRGVRAIQAELIWQTTGPTETPLTAFAQLIDESGLLRAQHDVAPGDTPSTGWVASEVVVSTHEIPVDRLAPGRYRLITGLYDPKTGRRIPQQSGADHLVLVELSLDR